MFDSREFRGAELNPVTPEQTLEMTEPEGTGSILDITEISDNPGYSCASPFESDELIDYFGTDKPT